MIRMMIPVKNMKICYNGTLFKCENRLNVSKIKTGRKDVWCRGSSSPPVNDPESSETEERSRYSKPTKKEQKNTERQMP